MSIYERIHNITTAFKHLNGHIHGYGESMQSDTPNVKVSLNGVLVDALGVSFNDLINRNLSLVINHPKFQHYPVCLKLRIGRDETLGWHDPYVKKQAEDAVGVGVTPEEVLDAIQYAVYKALKNFVNSINKDLNKIAP